MGSQSAVPTRQSDFLVHGDAVYVASVPFAVKPATADEIFQWSHDGRRLAYVSTMSNETPAKVDRVLASGTRRFGATRIGVWNRETGRSRDVFVAAEDKTGVGHFAFVGHDLIFSTSTPGSGDRLWIARSSGPAIPIPLPANEGISKILASHRRSAVLVVGTNLAWLIHENGTAEIRLPGNPGLVGRGVTKDDRAILMSSTQGGSVAWHLLDFGTGQLQRVAEAPDPSDRPVQRPFIVDAYATGRGTKASLLEEDPSAARVDAHAARISDEDGGFRMDLVERSGSPRRRIPFLAETARPVSISNDGLAFAFVSNRTLMVRWLVKLDRAAAEQRLRPTSQTRGLSN